MSILKMRDLTTKAEVLETYAELFDMFDDNKEICKELCKVYDKIRGLPTIEPKRGKWIRHVLKNANVPWGYDCSACGAWFIVGEDTIEKYDYCPNCGTRMEGAKNEKAKR